MTGSQSGMSDYSVGSNHLEEKVWLNSSSQARVQNQSKRWKFLRRANKSKPRECNSLRESYSESATPTSTIPAKIIQPALWGFVAEGPFQFQGV